MRPAATGPRPPDQTVPDHTSADPAREPAERTTGGAYDEDSGPSGRAKRAGRSPRPLTAATPVLDVDALLDDARTSILVCCGAGGVGKTTTAAALGLRAAERGRHVVVLTIDPARRLAQSLGLVELDNNPRCLLYTSRCV